MHTAKILAITPLLLVMYGCGGGNGSDSTTDSTTTSTTTSGVFIDAEVEGLSYTTDSGITGTTDVNGTYTFIPGENVSFSVGGVNLGTVPGAPVCTPFDFAAASTNIARFIQSLDADDDPTNGIDLVAASAALAGTTISSDAFVGDDATFAANTDIQGALATTGDTLLDPAVAVANLNAGTDTTFDNAELEGKLFVVIDPVESDIGLFHFETIASGAKAFSIFAGDTTAAGGDGLEIIENWAVGADGVLTLVDTVDGTITTVKRVGGSSRSISVTHSEDGSAPLPATLLIPEDLTVADLGGNIVDVISKTYGGTDTDGSPIDITFNSDGTWTDITNSETGTYAQSQPGMVVLTSDQYPEDITFLVLIDGDINVVGETVSMLILGGTIVSGPVDDPDIVFDGIGVASVTLVSTVAAP